MDPAQLYLATNGKPNNGIVCVVDLSMNIKAAGICQSRQRSGFCSITWCLCRIKTRTVESANVLFVDVAAAETLLHQDPIHDGIKHSVVSTARKQSKHQVAILFTIRDV